jgi:hypothetical protein
VYVIGDGGKDSFQLAQQNCEVPSGVFFIETMLKKLHGNAFDVECLTEEQPKEAEPLLFPALAERRADLHHYVDKEEAKSEKNEQVRIRIRNYSPPGKETGVQLSLRLPKPTKRRLLVAHHAAAAWYREEKLRSRSADFIKRFVSQEDRDWWRALELPSIIINLSGSLPELNSDASKFEDEPFQSDLWNCLYNVRQEVGIVLSVSTFRSLGGAITRRLSWEQAVEDTCAELYLYPRLRMLSRFRHLFIRNGQVGIVHIEHDPNSRGSNKLQGDVYFCPYAKGGIHRDGETQGTCIGRNTVLLAALGRAFGADKPADLAATITPSRRQAMREERRALLRSAFAVGLKAIRKMDDAGYDQGTFARSDGRALVQRSAAHAAAGLNWDGKTKPGHEDVLSWRPIPEHLLVAPQPNALRTSQKWHILDDVLLEAPVHRINVAMAIVKLGHDKVLNRRWCPEDCTNDVERSIWRTLTRVEYLNPRDRAPDFVTLEDDYWPATPQWPGGNSPTTSAIIGDVKQGFELNAPVSTIKFLTLIEREEVDTIRGVANLIRLYRTKAEQTKADAERNDKVAKAPRPLSIAVFGPPGSGKSFAVKQIGEHLGGGEIFPTLEFNIAQFRTLEQLGDAFKAVAKARREAKTTKLVTPLVFFDEFDCSWESQQLGWLKYFLAPMQDGRFQTDPEDLGPAIFVFAGGVYPSFKRFDPSTDSAFENLRHLEEYKQHHARFVAQKGPDFISRLRGHIDVLSINEKPGRIKHFIRRAVQLRSVLVQDHRVGDDGVARISDAVIYALLTVDRYRHGVRSMQAVVEMCSSIGGTIEIASLPSRQQLEMHVDAEEFLIRAHRGRARAEEAWEPSPTTELDHAARQIELALPMATASRRDKLRELGEQIQKALNEG